MSENKKNMTHNEIDSSNKEVTLQAFLSMIKEQRIIISVATTIVFLFFAVDFFISPKQYESNVLIQVQNKANNLGDFESLPKVFDNSAAPSDVQRALIYSRFILEPVINKMNLNISAAPHYFPIIGKYIQTQN
ncbi:MAG: hypothetical protein JSR33_06650, partial [Proteobacteria bacterium]|nr:hypothetical protein [Pseudomonadota bacterium]